MPTREAALARGFVLGQDDRIDPLTVEEFRRAGLGHLLAVSGQNVALLALLAMPLLALFGIPLRERLIWILALIAFYVPLTGTGPSVQRAAVMGALSLLALLAGRRASRLYGLALAALVTLAVEPRIAHDVGWQLSFAAVLGILLLAAPLREAIAARLGAGQWRSSLAAGAAMTIAATLATAPLTAFHFGALSTLTLAANLAAMPAVAPAMWLGMLAIAGGQLPGFPVELVNAVNAPLLAYIAQIAAWAAAPEWAYPDVRLGIAGLMLCYLALAAAPLIVMRFRRRARLDAARHRTTGRASWNRIPLPGLRGVRLPVLAASLSLLLALAVWLPGDGKPSGPPSGLRVSVLDVGQGDAILLQPARSPAVLVDAGPPGAGLLRLLRDAGVERLGALVLTHDQSDHAGGLSELLSARPVGRILYAFIDGWTRALVREEGIPLRRLAAGDELRSGALRLRALWPRPELLGSGAAGEDANGVSLVLLARWHGFSMLLTGDAEAEAAPLDPGPIDVLKVAHHGSEDGGLAPLLQRSRPRLAVISVGEGNPYGHPAASALAVLASQGVPVLRTDSEGTIVLDIGRRAISVTTGD